MKLHRLLDSDDRSIELHLALGALAVIVGLILAGWSVIVQSKPFDMMSYGTGIGALFTGIGIAAISAGLQRKAQGPGG